MTAAPHPANEAERLQALRDYGILDSVEEREYDDLTRLAALICGTPIALISLVDAERQWFKARVGWTARETPREQSFAAHAILEPGKLLVVNDAALDARFQDNPLVTTEPGIRFYAGAPLVTPGGLALGALCVMDRASRELPGDRLEALHVLARQVMAQVELRRTVLTLERSKQELQSREWELEDRQRQIEAANAQLEEQNIVDELTGMRNRRGFDRALPGELARAQRHAVPVSLLLVDVDKFRAFNSVYGRGNGNRALRTIADLLATRTRPFDVIARYDRGEFAVILWNTQEDAAVRVGDRLRHAVGSVPWKQQALTISVGASTVERAEEVTGLVEEADGALRHAQQSGGNLVRHASRYR